MRPRRDSNHSYRVHPQFRKAAHIYARRKQRAKAMAKIDALIARYRPRDTDARSPYADEGYDGFAGHDPGDVLDWQMYGIALPELEGSGHQEMSDAEIAARDARVDKWAGAHGVRLAEEPAPEIHPWGYWMEIDGAMVWTDDVD